MHPSSRVDGFSGVSALASRPTPTLSAYPTAEHPELGEISMAGVTLSDVAYWLDGDMHVFRSTEYDVIAADEDKHEAVHTFVSNSEEYAQFLADETREPTVDDLRLALVILQRLVESYAAADANRARRLTIVRMLRGHGHDAARGWHHHPSART